MFKNFLTTLSRQLWRNRLFTTLNIIGLSVSICVAWIIFRMVSFEYSFDKKFPGADQIYQVVSKSKRGDEATASGFAGVSRPIYNALKNDFSGLDLVVPMFYQYQHQAAVKDNAGSAKQFVNPETDIQIVSTTADYFNMLSYHWLAGDERTALDGPDKVVLTDSRAKFYFPQASPKDLLGKTIVYDDTVYRQVAGVVAQHNFPNSFSDDNNEFIAINQKDLADANWAGKSSNDLVYIKASAAGNISKAMSQLNALDTKHNGENFEKYNYRSWYDVLPLSEKHFQPRYAAQSRAVDKNSLNNLMIVGAFLLLLACINYINLSTAQLPQRAREIGIRKTLGSSSGALILRFMGETLALATLAAALSFLLTTIAVRLFKDFLPNGLLDYMNYPVMIGFLGLLVLLITIVSGLYPAWLASRVKTVSVLKGNTANIIGRHRFSARKGLIVFQFLVAQVFIIGSIIVHQQIKYALNKDLGFDKNGIITLQVPYFIVNDPRYKDKQFVLKDELLKNASLQAVSLGNRPMENSMMGNIMTYNDGKKEIKQQLNLKFGDTGYLGLYRFQLLAGRNYLPADTMKELVINEKAATAFGFKTPQEAIGKVLNMAEDNTANYPIVGVVRDFHQFGVKSQIEPAVISTNKSSSSVVNIKLPNDITKWKPAIQSVEKEWKRLYDGVPFTYTFYDETVQQLYESEEKLQLLVSTATGIAILISCLGLFGLATLTSFQRTKEIGIRKVLGASVSGIVRLLSTEFLLLVFLSVIIATPIAWWLMNKWLEDYAYRIDITWWIFVVAALAAGTIALLTVSYQSIKAALANPVKSLRTE